MPNFVIGTKSGIIALVNSAVFEKLDPAQRGGDILIEGNDAPVAGYALFHNVNSVHIYY